MLHKTNRSIEASALSMWLTIWVVRTEEGCARLTCKG